MAKITLAAAMRSEAVDHRAARSVSAGDYRPGRQTGFTPPGLKEASVTVALGISSSEVRELLPEAGVSVRRRVFPPRSVPGFGSASMNAVAAPAG